MSTAIPPLPSWRHSDEWAFDVLVRQPVAPVSSRVWRIPGASRPNIATWAARAWRSRHPVSFPILGLVAAVKIEAELLLAPGLEILSARRQRRHEVPPGRREAWPSRASRRYAATAVSRSSPVKWTPCGSARDELFGSMCDDPRGSVLSRSEHHLQRLGHRRLRHLSAVQPADDERAAGTNSPVLGDRSWIGRDFRFLDLRERVLDRGPTRRAGLDGLDRDRPGRRGQLLEPGTSRLDGIEKDDLDRPGRHLENAYALPAGPPGSSWAPGNPLLASGSRRSSCLKCDREARGSRAGRTSSASPPDRSGRA